MIESLENRQLLSAAPNSFVQTNLVSNTASIPAARTDGNLVNAWGVAINPSTGVVWVNANGTGLSNEFGADGSLASPPVTIPAPTGATGPSAPTGIALNTSRGFVVSNGTTSGPARFLFATEDGTIAGWNPSVDAASAITVVDQSTTATGGAIFKGITTASVHGRPVLYAADFHNNRVDVFNSSFNTITRTGAFRDTRLPAGFAPFNVQAVGNRIFVTYAKQDADAVDDVKGAGNGFVDVFSTSGRLLKRFASGGTLNSPWAVARAPSGFGSFGGDILVGNFGDGRINVFSPGGRFITQLKDRTGSPVTIDGLWGLQFGNGINAGRKTTLFFAAGPNNEADGLFGTLTPARRTTPPRTRSRGVSSGASGGGFTFTNVGNTRLRSIGNTTNTGGPPVGSGFTIRNVGTRLGTGVTSTDAGMMSVDNGMFTSDNGVLFGGFNGASSGGLRGARFGVNSGFGFVLRT